jgi:tryptophan synthase alpha chain
MPIRFDHKPGLVVYLTAGDPTLKATREIAIAAIDAGADVIELGVPFSDPLADGPVIQRASERALAHGTRLRDVLAVAREIRAARPAAGLVIFSYFNPILRYGLARYAEITVWKGGPPPMRTPGGMGLEPDQWGLGRFAGEVAEAGADGVLVTDLIVEEAGLYLVEMENAGLAPIFLAAPTSPDARLEAIAKHSRGFVYAISRVGVTGTQQNVAADAAALVERIRRYTHLPVAVGFGISNAEHVAQVAGFADAAVIGSAIVALIEKSTEETAPEAVSRFIKGLRLRDAALAR